MNGNEHFCALFWLIFADSARDKLRKISILSVGKLVIRSGFEPETPSLKGMCSTC